MYYNVHMIRASFFNSNVLIGFSLISTGNFFCKFLRVSFFQYHCQGVNNCNNIITIAKDENSNLVLPKFIKILVS